MRFRAMDRNGDGVVTRAEWQGSDQYQAGYREGFRQGYAEGYGPRRGTGDVAVPLFAGKAAMLRIRGVACCGGE
jgi:hypothetical protein